jgi:hypothetical protein
MDIQKTISLASEDLQFILKELGTEDPDYEEVQAFLQDNEEIEVEIECEVELGSDSGAELLNIGEMSIVDCGSGVADVILPFIISRVHEELAYDEFSEADMCF